MSLAVSSVAAPRVLITRKTPAATSSTMNRDADRYADALDSAGSFFLFILSAYLLRLGGVAPAARRAGSPVRGSCRQLAACIETCASLPLRRVRRPSAPAMSCSAAWFCSLMGANFLSFLCPDSALYLPAYFLHVQIHAAILPAAALSGHSGTAGLCPAVPPAARH